MSPIIITGVIVTFIASIINIVLIAVPGMEDNMANRIHKTGCILFAAGIVIVLIGIHYWNGGLTENYFSTLDIQSLKKLANTSDFLHFTLLWGCMSNVVFILIYSLANSEDYSKIKKILCIGGIIALIVAGTISCHLYYTKVFTPTVDELYSTTKSCYEIISMDTIVEEKGASYIITTADGSVYTADSDAVTIMSYNIKTDYGEFEVYNHPNDDGSARIKNIVIYN